MQQYRELLNHLVGTRKQYRWHLNSNRLCRLGVDHQFKFRGLLNGQIGWFGPLQSQPYRKNSRIFARS